MGISIVETVTGTGAGFTFSDVWAGDVAVVAVLGVDDGSGLGSLTLNLGWLTFYFTGVPSLMAWKQLAAGETIHGITADHASINGVVATLLRSDTDYGNLPSRDLTLSNGSSGTTGYASEVILAHAGNGSVTSSGFTSIGTAGNLVMYAGSPTLQVASGTSYSFTLDSGATSGCLVSFIPWNSSTPPGPPAALLAAVAGSFAWIID